MGSTSSKQDIEEEIKQRLEEELEKEIKKEFNKEFKNVDLSEKEKNKIFDEALQVGKEDLKKICKTFYN